ncbi:MAG: DotU family type IV/VI secretion system protein [Smithellaceae bacterium]
MHLSDYFIELVAYITFFLRANESRQISSDQMKNDIQRLLSASEDGVRKGLISSDDYEQARFAVCAWIDETLLNSSWSGKEAWMRQQLQRIYYQTTDAGEIFFDRLNRLGPHQLEVREVYYLCLALGFTGRYFNDDYNLEQIKTINLKLLMGSSLGLPSLERVELFPEAYPAGDAGMPLPAGQRRNKWFVAVCATAPLVLFIALFVTYYFILDNVGENYLRMVLK